MSWSEHRVPGYTIRVNVKDDTWMDFEVYEVVGWNDGPGDEDKLLYQRKGSNHSPDPVETFEEAETFAHGYVKWDGCMGFTLDDSPHFCGKRDGEQFGAMVAALWDIGKKVVPHWDSACADTENER